jgi:hypothetical protein
MGTLRKIKFGYYELSPPNGRSGGDEPPAIDPIIAGLLKRLPKSGDVWPESDRKLWLNLLEGSFKLIYKDKNDLGVPPHVVTGEKPQPTILGAGLDRPSVNKKILGNE